MKYPKNLGACVDALYTMRSERLELSRMVDEKKQDEDKLQAYILAQFDKTELEGARGKKAVCSVSRKMVPAVKDWGKVYDFIKKNGDFDLMERRLSITAFRARLDDGVVIPGVETFHAVKLHLNKAASKE